jgi:hypothetical protein
MTDETKRWMQTGSGGAVVAARVESAASQATAKVLETHRKYLVHAQKCQPCAAVDKRCAAGELLWLDHREAQGAFARVPR